MGFCLAPKFVRFAVSSYQPSHFKLLKTAIFIAKLLLQNNLEATFIFKERKSIKLAFPFV